MKGYVLKRKLVFLKRLLDGLGSVLEEKALKDLPISTNEKLSKIPFRFVFLAGQISGL